MANQEPEVHGALQGIRRIVGISFIIAGVSLMDTRFWLGYGLAGVGFILLIWEVCQEPELLKRAIWIQVVAVAVCFVGFATLTISLVSSYAPVNVMSYSPRNGEYPLGTVIGGIEWDRHFADLRVSITNPGADDYDRLDFLVQPDTWIYKTAFLARPDGCELTPVIKSKLLVSVNSKGGATRITSTPNGDDTDVHDNAGDVFTTLATDGGYRLRCQVLPSHYTIQLVFSLISPDPSLMSSVSAPPGQRAYRYSEIAGAKSEFDILAEKPNPSTVTIEGHFQKNKQPFSVEKVVQVADGN